MDFNEQEYLEEQRIIEEMFPNADFSICLELGEFEEVMSNEEQIVIQLKPCKIVCGETGNTKYVYVNNNGNGIRVKDMINAMIEQDCSPSCNHHFLEGFDKINEITFEPYFGS